MAQGPLGSPSYLPLPSLAERTLSPKLIWGPAHWLRQATWEGRFQPGRGGHAPPAFPPPLFWGQEPSLTSCVVTASLTTCDLACHTSCLVTPHPSVSLATQPRCLAWLWVGGAGFHVEGTHPPPGAAGLEEPVLVGTV